MTKIGVAALPLLAILAGCEVHDLGPARTSTRSVELDGAELVRAVIRMGAGELHIDGGARELMEAEFRTNWSVPDVRYEVTGSRGRLSVEQTRKGPLGNMVNEWKLRLSPEVPIDLEVHLGAGENQINLSRMAPRSVEIHMGAGELRLDLTGAYKRSFDVRVHGGIGEANVRLPRDIGVSARASGGIGSIDVRGLRKRGDAWINEAYNDSNVRLNVEVHGGIGAIHLRGDI